MYHMSTQGVDERTINVHYYYFHFFPSSLQMSSMNDPIGHTLSPLLISTFHQIVIDRSQLANY